MLQCFCLFLCSLSAEVEADDNKVNILNIKLPFRENDHVGQTVVAHTVGNVVVVITGVGYIEKTKKP